MTRRVTVGVGVFVGLVWAVVQLIYNSAAVSLSDLELTECGVDPSSTGTFRLLSVGVCLAASLAFAASFQRRQVVVVSLLGVEGVLVLLWFAEGGWKAASCAIE